MAGAVALASQGYIAAIDDSPFPFPPLFFLFFSPLRRVREAQGRVQAFERGLDRSPGSSAGVPFLSSLSPPFFSFPAKVYYDLTKSPQKISGVLTPPALFFFSFFGA